MNEESHTNGTLPIQEAKIQNGNGLSNGEVNNPSSIKTEEEESETYKAESIKTEEESKKDFGAEKQEKDKNGSALKAELKVKVEEEAELLSSSVVKKEEEDDEEDDEDDDDDDDEEDEDDEEEESSSSSEEEEENSRSKLRVRPVNVAAEAARKERELIRQVGRIVRKSESNDGLSKEEERLLAAHPKLFDEVTRRASRRKTTEARKLEVEDSPIVLAKKCERMAKAVHRAKSLIVYTGAGISTAANIPDYRGPNGVWTLLDQGRDVADCNPALAEPTFTHMALFTLFKKGKLKHVVSQNCDGLHLRSGIPRYALSEVHGNMYIEICKQCKPMRPYIRLFDVTERTNKNRHSTMRRCRVCGKGLVDTIVHFGERGSLKWPINWDGASKAAEKADVIICLGSSLKVLRRYPWLWCMDRPKKLRPKLYIINLQWTPKDSAATVKLNGRCDDVMRQLMSHLELEVPGYHAGNDPLLSYATPLHPLEEHTSTRQPIIGAVKNEDQDGDEDIKSWSLDHSYHNENGSCDLPKRQARRSSSKANRGGGGGRLMPRKGVDYRNAVWPRDALYIPYKDEKFEFVVELEAAGQPAYHCDCCDPLLKRKRRHSSDSSDDEQEDDNDDEDDDGDDEELDVDSTTSGSVSSKMSSDKTEAKTEACKEEEDEDVKSETDSSNTSSRVGTPATVAPGWFGKGRRKKNRI